MPASRRRPLSGLSLIVVIGLAVSASARQQTQAPPRQVLFLCPHGAAKSILASAYFERLAKEKGLNVRVEAAGTDPDPAISPKVADHLTKNGYTTPAGPPRRVTEQDVAKADLVISLGCDLKGISVPEKSLRRWDEVPGPGENFAGADAAIRQRVEALVDELLKQVK